MSAKTLTSVCMVMAKQKSHGNNKIVFESKYSTAQIKATHMTMSRNAKKGESERVERKRQT